MNKILVTGGNGFIGTNFITRAIDNYGAMVINVDKNTYASNDVLDNMYTNTEHYTKKEMDICDLRSIDLTGVKMVINFAAESHVDNSISGPMVFERTNVFGTLHLLELCRQHNNTHKTDIGFLQVSTDEVYGSLKSDEPAFTEDHQIKPNSPYSASKASADAFVRAYHKTYGMNTMITRCSNNYGPHQHGEKFIPKIIENAILGKSIPIYGDGLQVRDWLYVDDHCDAILKVLNNGVSGEVYNIGGNNEQTNIDIVKAILKIMSIDFDIAVKEGLVVFTTDRLGHDRRYAMNHSKLSKTLGWNPICDFKTGLELTIDNVREKIKKVNLETANENKG